MFTIPPVTLSFWQRLDLQPASSEQIRHISDLAPGPLPEEYQSFLETYGFARWMLTMPDRFTYSREEGGQTIAKTGSLAHLETPESIARAMQHAWQEDADLGLPCWPRGVMPVAGNAGPGQVLMDFRRQPGTILYWEPRDDPWGQGDNTALW